MKRLFYLFSLIIIFLFTSLFLIVPKSSSDEYDNITEQINDLKSALDMSINATKPLESQLNSIKNEIEDIKESVYLIEQDLKIKKRNIDDGYNNLSRKETVLRSSVRDFYIQSYYSSPLLIFLSLPSYSHIIQVLTYQKEAVDQDKAIITNIALSIQDLKIKEENLKNKQSRLAKLKIGLDEQSAKLDEIVTGAKAYQSDVLGQIAKLTARQQEILSAKSGTFTTSVGEVPLADDPNASPNYNPGFAPSFAAFSFGAFTHRNGMSQYGAKGRAEQGQSAEQILAFYYPGASLNKSYSEPATINVLGFGTRGFEDEYMKRIYEMPNSFPKEALKAQAVAARTYAIRQNGSICPTESCQVYKDSNKGGAWEEAVSETRGWVLEGGPNAQYSSTTGGFSNNSGWDTTTGAKDAWTQGAYEKLGASPWFYKGWYTQGYTITSATCGHSHPWLNLEEMSDILNAYLIQNKSGVDNGRITPITTSCWGGNPYSINEVKDYAESKGGGAVTSIYSVSVVYSNEGKTATVTFNTNRGDISIGGSDFKQIFNLRAPGYISIKSPLYNIERK